MFDNPLKNPTGETELAESENRGSGAETISMALTKAKEFFLGLNWRENRSVVMLIRYSLKTIFGLGLIEKSWRRTKVSVVTVKTESERL